MNSCLICDVTSLFNAACQKHEGKTLAYVGFDKWLEEQLSIRVLYKGLYIRNQKPKQAIKFITLAKSEGYEVFCDKKDWSIHMALKVADFLPSYDSFVLATDDPRHLQLASWLKSKGKVVYHACFMPAKYYAENSTRVLTITHVRDRPNATPSAAQSVELPTDGILNANGNSTVVCDSANRA